MITVPPRWTRDLVVAATDGVMPQTREAHLARKAGWSAKDVVFLNKVDMVDDKDLVDLVEEEVGIVKSRDSRQRRSVIRWLRSERRSRIRHGQCVEATRS